MATKLVVKRGKKPDFSEDEKLALITSIKSYWSTINASFSSSVTKEKKDRAWGQVAVAVNAAGSAPRSVLEVSKFYTQNCLNVLNVLSNR